MRICVKMGGIEPRFKLAGRALESAQQQGVSILPKLLRCGDEAR